MKWNHLGDGIMTKKTHKCDDACTHPPKRKMGTSKREVTVNKPKSNNTSPKITTQGWQSTVASSFGLPNGLKNELLQEIESTFSDIWLSDNEYARAEARTLIDECRMKLVNLKRDCSIG